MIIKKPALTISAYSNLVPKSTHIAGNSSSTSSTSGCRRRIGNCGYATARDDVPPPGDESAFVDSWPEPLHPHKVPTPYQILQIHRGERYSKHRFTELVKLYHPDRFDHPSHARLCRCLPAHARLERYRLIIAAHAILSDPLKRQAYDAFGAGWGQHENVSVRDRNGNPAPSDGPDSAMGNATWEDWERWYRRRDQEAGHAPPPPQRPVFLSNTAFVGLVILLAALGGVGQATRADATSKTVLHVRDETHRKAALELARVRADAMNWTKEERIAMFLRMRDPAAYRNEGLRKLMLDPDICDNAAGRHCEADVGRRYTGSSFGTRQTPEELESAAGPPPLPPP